MKSFSLVTLFFSFFCYVSLAFASPRYLNVQSKIIKPDGTPLEASSVNFRITFTDPVGTCVVFQEDFTNVNMANSKGLAAIQVGTGTQSFPVAPITMPALFTNFGSPVFNCQSGGTFTAANTDERKMILQFNDGTGWQTLPSMTVNSVPFAMTSNIAHSLGAFPAADYVRTAQFTSCNSGEAVFFNGTSFTCVPITSGVSNGGNTGATTIGTNDASNFTIETNNSPRLTVDSTGNIGIGTATPGYALTVADPIVSIGAGFIEMDGSGNDMMMGISNDIGASNGSVVYGRQNSARYDNSIALGIQNTINTPAAFSSTVVGRSNTVTVASAIAMGHGITNSTAGSMMLGPSDASKMTILTNGNVGIGNSNPGKQLDVTGTGRFSYQALIGPGTPAGGGGYGYLYVNRNTGSTGDHNIVLDNVEFGANKSSSIDFRTGGSNYATIYGGQDASALGVLAFSTGGGGPVERMRIDSTGNVGIGTTNPTNTLSVVNTTLPNLNTASLVYLSHNSGSGQSAITTDQTQAGSWLTMKRNGTTLGQLTSNNNEFNISTGGNSNAMTFGTGPSERMRITSTGDVGIGTSTPAEKLDVNGAIKVGDTATTNAGTIRWDGSNFYGYTGVAWQAFVPTPPSSSACDNTVTYSTAGTYAYTAPAVFGTITIRLWGGGGSGGNHSTTNVGSAGGNSSISSLGLQANGGAAGISQSVGADSAGGTATGGDINTNGGLGTAPGGGFSGTGGSAASGGTGGAGRNNSGNGLNGSAPGGGGGGATNTGGPGYGSGGGGGGFVEKAFTTLELIPLTTVSDIIVGTGGIPNLAYGGPGGYGGVGRITITCVSAGSPPINNRSLVFQNGGNYTSDSNLVFDSDSELGVGTPAPSEKLHVVGNLRVEGSTDCTLGNGAGGTSCSSDIRLKNNVTEIENALSKILQIRGVDFDWNEKS